MIKEIVTQSEIHVVWVGEWRYEWKVWWEKTESGFIFKDRENENERGRVVLEREKNKEQIAWMRDYLKGEKPRVWNSCHP